MNLFDVEKVKQYEKDVKKYNRKDDIEVLLVLIGIFIISASLVVAGFRQEGDIVSVLIPSLMLFTGINMTTSLF